MFQPIGLSVEQPHFDSPSNCLSVRLAVCERAYVCVVRACVLYLYATEVTSQLDWSHVQQFIIFFNFARGNDELRGEMRETFRIFPL